MTQDEMTMYAAKVLYGRLTIGDFPGGEVQKIASIQVFLNELLDADHLTSNPAGKVAGYTPQPDAKVALVNEFKADEERLLRKLDALDGSDMDRHMHRFAVALRDMHKDEEEKALLPEGKQYDSRWIAIARGHFQEGFMALNRAVFQPQRIRLPEDGE